MEATCPSHNPLKCLTGCDGLNCKRESLLPYYGPQHADVAPRPEFGNCGAEHRWGRATRTMRSIGYVSIFHCNNCLAVKVEQQQTGREDGPVITTVVDMANSAYPHIKSK